jgi:hypothetical protein
MCLAVGFVVLRLLAAANNPLLSAGLVGSFGAAVGAVGERTSPVVGLAVVTGVALVALAVGLSPVLPGCSLDKWPRTLSRPPHQPSERHEFADATAVRQSC